jgi:Uma2 family endonuclease
MATRPARSSDSRDVTVYPVEEKVGEETLQRFIVELLRPLIERYLAERGVRALTGADQFIYFRRGDVRGRVAPDVYVLPGVRPNRRVRSWKTWQDKVVPSFALEVVSTDVDKDYIDTPPLYRELGVKELIIFDPDYEEGPERVRFQVYRPVAGRERMRAIVTNEDRVRSRALGCYVRAVGSGEETRLRLGVGPQGDNLYPTEAEAERIDRDRERLEKERLQARLAEAEREVERLRTELGRVRGTPRRA